MRARAHFLRLRGSMIFFSKFEGGENYLFRGPGAAAASTTTTKIFRTAYSKKNTYWLVIVGKVKKLKFTIWEINYPDINA